MLVYQWMDAYGPVNLFHVSGLGAWRWWSERYEMPVEASDGRE